uniref:Uncharacterized protein n=1 Tax=Meloidogyne enterolobii TaxID=390850 RepID=A0A6V7V410_MELEN|nr:unnamed protein product [Meloidogyne enterolobii]
MSNEFFEIKFTLDISENSRDFWLFKNVDNSTELIATRRCNIFKLYFKYFWEQTR